MTVLTVVKSAAPQMGIAIPSALFSATDRTSLEVQTALKSAALMIARRFDWQELKKFATLTGDGSAVDFNLPADYDRMLKKARLWPSATPNSPLTHYPDSDTWLGISVQDFIPVIGAWTIYGGQVHIKPVLANEATVQFAYVSNLIAADNDGAPKLSFTSDTDTFRLDEELLRLALVYRWKQAKGRAYAQELGDFEEMLGDRIGHNKGSTILTIGDVRVPTGLDAPAFAFPGTIQG